MGVADHQKDQMAQFAFCEHLVDFLFVLRSSVSVWVVNRFSGFSLSLLKPGRSMQLQRLHVKRLPVIRVNVEAGIVKSPACAGVTKKL